MRRLLAAALAALCLSSCASSGAREFRPYRVCIWNSARTFFDVGTVVAESRDENGVIYRVQLDRWPSDGKHLKDVRLVDRVCRAAVWQGPSSLPPIDQQK